MDLFFLDKPKYHRLYNCSLYDVDQLPYDQRAHPYWGSAFLVGYVIFMSLYVPCLWAMCANPDLRQKSSYKLMIQLGFTQIIGLQFAGLYTGFEAIFGTMFCSAPDFQYIMGSIVCTHWVITSTTCDVLGINRLCALYSPLLVNKMFGGKKLWFWMALPLIYGSIMFWLMPPLLYSSKFMAQFSNPHFDYIPDTKGTYLNPLFAFHNTTICFTELFIYIAMPLLYFRARKVASDDFKSRIRYEKQIYVQVIFIGLVNFTASLIYDTMQFMPMSFATTLTGTTAWFFSQSIVSVLYLTINRSIRNTIMNKLGLWRTKIIPAFISLNAISSTRQNLSVEVPRPEIYVRA